MDTQTATQTTTAIDLTPDTLQAIARLIAAVEKITIALGRIDNTIEDMSAQLVTLAEESQKQTTALEQIQLYQR